MKKPCAGKRMADKSYFGPRSLRRNYPHQVQGVRPGRLSRVGSPAVLLTLKWKGGRRKWKLTVAAALCRRAPTQRSGYSYGSRPDYFLAGGSFFSVGWEIGLQRPVSFFPTQPAFKVPGLYFPT